MKKAWNHRKRHMPPGPCGIWFQTQQQLNKGGGGSDIIAHSGTNSSRKRKNGNTSSIHESASASLLQDDDDDDGGGVYRQSQLTSDDDSPSPSSSIGAAADMSFSPAWTWMQQEFNLITPYLPPTMTTPEERYRQLRPYMPSEYALLFEIQRGDHDRFDSAISPEETTTLEQSLLVFVSNVESHIHHNIWTVELKDETGALVKAWIEPTLVQQQLQQPQESSVIRPGVVWRLERVGMILVVPQVEDTEERLERMLLIRGTAIAQVWTPEQSQRRHADDPEHDTPRRQKQFLEWMERRKALPLIAVDNHENNTNASNDAPSAMAGKSDMDECDEDGNDNDNDEDNDDSGPPDEDLEEYAAYSPAGREMGKDITHSQEEDEEDRLEQSHFSASLWNTTTGLTSSSRSHRTNSQSQSQATSRPATQDFGTHQPQPWSSRPRRQETETAPTLGREITVHPNNKNNDDHDPTPRQVTIGASVSYIQDPLLRRVVSHGNPNQGASHDKEPTSHPYQNHSQLEDRQSSDRLSFSQNVNQTEPIITNDGQRETEVVVDTSNVQLNSTVSVWNLPSQNSSFWNSMLDEDDSDQEDDNRRQHETKSQPMTTNESAAAAAATTTNDATVDMQRQNACEQDNASDVDDQQLNHVDNVPSMFAAGNLGDMDIAGFSDGDDD